MSRTPQPERVRTAAALLLLALIVAGSFASRVGSIEGSLPYPRHIDERFVSVPALGIVQSGSLDPDFFRYPSLPIYLASIGMSVGSALSVASGDLESRADIRSVEAPYYSHPMVMRVPRILHAALSSATLLLVAAIGYRLRPSAGMLVLGPAVLASNSFYHEEGWLYLNVDMVASLFALAVTLQLLRAAENPSFRSLVVGPAVLCGATIASKYPSGLVLAPAALAIFWYAPRERRAQWVAILLFGSATAFVLFCPYAVLGFDRFLAGVLREVNHYATGRAHHEANPGLDQMIYYGHRLLRQSGPLLAVLAGVGTVSAWRSDWRRAVLLGLFPVSLFLLLAAQRVHFHRNLIPGYGMLAVAAGLGIHVLYTWLAARLGFLRRPWLEGCVAGTTVLIAVVASLPVGSISNALQPRVDSRNQATEWIGTNLAAGGTLVVPDFLPFAGHGLPDSVVLVRSQVDDAPRSLPAHDCYVIAPDSRTRSNEAQTRTRASRREDWLSRFSIGTPVAEFGQVPLERGGTWNSRLRIQVLACRSGH